MRAHRHQIIIVPSSSLPSHRCHPIVLVVVVDVIIVLVVVAAAIAVHVIFVIVAIVATILLVGFAAIAVAVVAVIVNIVALLLLCLSYSLVVNPRNMTKASQCGITHGMMMERLHLGWP